MRNQESYTALVARTLAELGIPATYGADRKLPVHPEAADLVSIGLDIHGRERHLAPEAAARWAELRAAAQQDGIGLLLVSAFRSLEYQRQIFLRKLAGGEPLEEILKVNAAPGYSEHHTGRAIDLASGDCPSLSEEFENTPAFRWLMENAHRFGFTLTYPRGNASGMAYEPWHWTAREPAG